MHKHKTSGGRNTTFLSLILRRCVSTDGLRQLKGCVAYQNDGHIILFDLITLFSRIIPLVTVTVVLRAVQ